MIKKNKIHKNRLVYCEVLLPAQWTGVWLPTLLSVSLDILWKSKVWKVREAGSNSTAEQGRQVGVPVSGCTDSGHPWEDAIRMALHLSSVPFPTSPNMQSQCNLEENAAEATKGEHPTNHLTNFLNTVMVTKTRGSLRSCHCLAGHKRTWWLSVMGFPG